MGKEWRNGKSGFCLQYAKSIFMTVTTHLGIKLGILAWQAEILPQRQLTQVQRYVEIAQLETVAKF